MTMTDETYVVNCIVNGETKEVANNVFAALLAGAIGWLVQ